MGLDLNMLDQVVSLNAKNKTINEAHRYKLNLFSNLILCIGLVSCINPTSLFMVNLIKCNKTLGILDSILKLFWDRGYFYRMI